MKRMAVFLLLAAGCGCAGALALVSDGSTLSRIDASNGAVTTADSSAFAPTPAAIWLFSLGAAGVVLYRRYR